MELVPGIFILMLTRQHASDAQGSDADDTTRVSEMGDGYDTDATEDLNIPPVYMPPLRGSIPACAISYCPLQRA